MQYLSPKPSPAQISPKVKPEHGFTLVELIAATAILLTLSLLAIPIERAGIKREKERELHFALWQMRDAIDRYKDACDRAAFRSKVDSECYPPDLDKLVNGEDVN